MNSLQSLPGPVHSLSPEGFVLPGLAIVLTLYPHFDQDSESQGGCMPMSAPHRPRERLKQFGKSTCMSLHALQPVTPLGPCHQPYEVRTFALLFLRRDNGGFPKATQEWGAGALEHGRNELAEGSGASAWVGTKGRCGAERVALRRAWGGVWIFF